MASIALANVVEQYNHWTGTNPRPDFWKELMPTAGVSVISLVIFVLSITIIIYMGKMKATVYIDATERIQYHSVLYQAPSNELTEEEFKKLINKIYRAARKSKTKTSFKKTVISILVGGDDE